MVRLPALAAGQRPAPDVRPSVRARKRSKMRPKQTKRCSTTASGAIPGGVVLIVDVVEEEERKCREEC